MNLNSHAELAAAVSDSVDPDCPVLGSSVALGTHLVLIIEVKQKRNVTAKTNKKVALGKCCPPV